ncbi:DUF2274 domain-containing protein [Rhizobium giardinii]
MESGLPFTSTDRLIVLMLEQFIAVDRGSAKARRYPVSTV